MKRHISGHYSGSGAFVHKVMQDNSYSSRVSDLLLHLLQHHCACNKHQDTHQDHHCNLPLRELLLTASDIGRVQVCLPPAQQAISTNVSTTLPMCDTGALLTLLQTVWRLFSILWYPCTLAAASAVAVLRTAVLGWGCEGHPKCIVAAAGFMSKMRY